ncbi:hypothetical protein [Lentzea nigeriaca]|uniref:hypothetical protein n=1 Tax=Lentzea nigeriaca TaxID=1128665 RepID=UPI001959EE44|nr:hypothetical protein [Lentzea nigeriaca]MBM7861787.1 hypothetical protein [Lentzea nigeriaca]
MVTRTDERRREQSAQLLRYFRVPSYGLGWAPVLDDDGRPVPYKGAQVEITAELIAALANEGDVFGRDTVITTEMANDVALTLRGEAIVASVAGGTS